MAKALIIYVFLLAGSLISLSESTNMPAWVPIPKCVHPRHVRLFPATGFGAEMEPNIFMQASPEQLRALLRDVGFVVVRGMNLTENEYRAIMKPLGTVVEYTGNRSAVGYGYRDILKIDNKSGKTLLGADAIPLHMDGWLTKRQVDIVSLYAQDIQNLGLEGATPVCDHKLAIKELPSDLKATLMSSDFEINIVDHNYFKGNVPENWWVLPTITDLGWVKKLIMYFPFPDNQEPSWYSRIKGSTLAESRKFYERLFAFFSQPRYYTRHYWKAGDLVIMDNRRVIHGREPFSGNVVRKLWRIQLENDYVAII